jgi:hypothetical protein
MEACATSWLDRAASMFWPLMTGTWRDNIFVERIWKSFKCE